MNVLQRIVEVKRRELAQMAPRSVHVDHVRAALDQRGGGRRNFLQALRDPRGGTMALIAEVKKASPSAGVIRSDFDPVTIAQEYERAGATCLSVLTDQQFFKGSLEYLRAIREVVGLPLLRKDFLLDPRQVVESVEWGADAVLLIVAILSDAELRQLHDLATGAGLTALVEVHDEAELERALSVDAQLIGVNNRDLRTFQIDLGTTERVAARLRKQRLQEQVLLVAESGILTRSDVERLERCGATAVLVGESLMRESDLARKAAELLGLDASEQENTIRAK